jgi:hypothetical protein
VPVQSVSGTRRLTMAQVPAVLPVRLPASRPVPAWLGGELVTHEMKSAVLSGASRAFVTGSVTPSPDRRSRGRRAQGLRRRPLPYPWRSIPWSLRSRGSALPGQVVG